MISRTAEYALRAVVFLADQTETPWASAEIAAAIHVPGDYLSKVMRQLGKAKIVRSRPGLHGGFTLTREPDQIPLLAVINAVDPIERVHDCPMGIPGHRTLCPLHRRLDEATGLVETTFRDTTVADLIDKSLQHPSCDFGCCEAGAM